MNDELKRVFWAPCRTKEHLHNWIERFLGVDLPDGRVCDDEIHADPTSSSPMDFAWEVYRKAMAFEGIDWNFEKVLAYAARDSGKTLVFAILEVLALFHMQRNVAHAAAIEQQAAKASSYVKKFLSREILKDFVIGDNKRTIEVCWYQTTDGSVILPWKVFQDLYKTDSIDSKLYVQKKYYIKILVATMASLNSEHVPFVCLDGNTQILTKTPPGFASKRLRISRTARGIYNRLAGMTAGGRPSTLPGPQEAIREVKEQIEALTMNLVSGTLEWKNIVGATKSFKKTLVITAGGKTVQCTAEHPFYVQGKGFVQAGDIAVGNRLLFLHKGHTDVVHDKVDVEPSVYQPYVARSQDDEWEQALLGSLLGDAGIYVRKTGNPYISEQHCVEQREYLEWKRSLFHLKLRTVDRKCKSGYTGREQVGFFSGHSPVLVPYRNFKKDLAGVERLGPLGLAIWYQDDGCKGRGLSISTESFTLEQNQKLVSVLASNFGIKAEARAIHRNGKIYYHLYGDVSAKRLLAEICAPHIHPSMAYKFDVEQHRSMCRQCGSPFWFYERGSYVVDCGNAICRAAQAGHVHLVSVDNVVAADERWCYDFTLEGGHNFFANGFLTHNCLDELDLIPEKPYREALSIPCPTEDGRPPIILQTSTRKFAFGLVQKEIDEAPDTGLQIRHWSLLDVTKPCPPDRHLPLEPKVDLFYSTDTLRTIQKDDYELLIPEEQKRWYRAEGYAGCKTCPIFAQCRGRLATRQKSNSKFLKDVREVINVFKRRAKDPEFAKSQLLCWKPGGTGLIYPLMSPDLHFKTAAEMAEMITGDPYPEETSKAQLIDAMRAAGVKFYAGMDFGYTHAFAVVLAALWGQTLYIIEVISVTEFELGQKLELCKRLIMPFDPIIYPDPAYPSDIKSFRRAGFRMVNFKKEVLEGISAVRSKLMPTMAGTPEVYFLAGDPNVDLLFNRMRQYHWLLDSAGKPTDEPDDTDDDECDAMRYLCQNLFGKKMYQKAPASRQAIEEPSLQAQAADTNKKIMEQHLKLLSGRPDGDGATQVYRKANKFFSV